MLQSLVAVLIANPARPAVEAALLARVGAALDGAPARVLAKGVAVEWDVAGEPIAIRRKLDAVVGNAPVDVALLPSANRRKRLLIADMDSTMIEQECIDELADALGLAEAIAPITEAAMRGVIAFEPALRQRAALFGGAALEPVVARILRDRITLMPGAAQTVATLRAHGVHTALVSGGFSSFVAPVAETLGFDEQRSNVLEIDAQGLSTGLLREPVLGLAAKAEILDAMLADRRLTRADALAVGDGANDVAMLEAAGLGVAFRGKPPAIAAADVSIVHGDLTALLYLQGYTADEIAGGQNGAAVESPAATMR